MQVDHVSARPDSRLTVGAEHVLECPFIWMNFQPPLQVSHRVRQTHPGDFTALGQVDLRVDLDVAFGPRPGPCTGTRETVACTFTSPLALKSSTTLRTFNGIALLIASSIASDSAFISN